MKMSQAYVLVVILAIFALCSACNELNVRSDVDPARVKITSSATLNGVHIRTMCDTHSGQEYFLADNGTATPVLGQRSCQ